MKYEEVTVQNQSLLINFIFLSLSYKSVLCKFMTITLPSFFLFPFISSHICQREKKADRNDIFLSFLSRCVHRLFMHSKLG